MKLILVFILFVSCVWCTRSTPSNCPINDYSNPCNQHTDIFNQFKTGQLKANQIFQLNTYLPGNIDPCESYNGGNDRYKYIKKLMDVGVMCKIYCNDGNKPGGYNCPTQKGKKNECLQVEHIIDKSNSDMVNEGMNVNIYGNIVMTYSVWNNQMSHKSWDLIVLEKSLIYGDLFMKARENIRYCNNKNTESIEIFVIVSIITVVLIVLIIFIVLYVNIKNKKDPTKYVKQIDEEMLPNEPH